MLKTSQTKYDRKCYYRRCYTSPVRIVQDHALRMDCISSMDKPTVKVSTNDYVNAKDGISYHISSTLITDGKKLVISETTTDRDKVIKTLIEIYEIWDQFTLTYLEYGYKPMTTEKANKMLDDAEQLDRKYSK